MRAVLLAVVLTCGCATPLSEALRAPRTLPRADARELQYELIVLAPAVIAGHGFYEAAQEAVDDALAEVGRKPVRVDTAATRLTLILGSEFVELRVGDRRYQRAAGQPRDDVRALVRQAADGLR